MYYGKKYRGGKPGSGTERTATEMLASTHRSKAVSANTPCTIAEFGGDPASGYYKRCWCLTGR